MEDVRGLFDLQEGVTYLDSASTGVLPLPVQRAAVEAVASKVRPWTRDRAQAQSRAGEARALAAGLIGAAPEDMAITCAVSYGLASACRNLPLAVGESVLVLEGDHTSQLLTWSEHARRSGGLLDAVRRPEDGNWTAAILAHLRNPAKRPPAIASLGATYWRDGSCVDLVAVCAELHRLGTRIVLDLTQSAGILEHDVRVLQPDYAMFPMYKWLLGPYSFAFLYVAPHRQDGEPLEQNVFNRDGGSYAAGATRFDMGERDTFVGIPTAIAALQIATRFDRKDLRRHLSQLTGRLAAALESHGLDCVPEAYRSPHILGIRGVPSGMAPALRAQGVIVTQRESELRVSPHVFNTPADMDRCAGLLARLR
jgi:selenocysteine lyase/cysteine desulfurase